MVDFDNELTPVYEEKQVFSCFTVLIVKLDCGCCLHKLLESISLKRQIMTHIMRKYVCLPFAKTKTQLFFL